MVDENGSTDLIFVADGGRDVAPEPLRLERHLLVGGGGAALEALGAHLGRRVPQDVALAGPLVLHVDAVVPVAADGGQRLLAQTQLPRHVVHRIGAAQDRLRCHINDILTTSYLP